MKIVEFKKVSLASVFTLFGGMNFVLGFVIGLLGGDIGGQFKGQLQNIPYIGNLLTGFWGAIIFGLLSAILGGLYFTLMAVIYNVFAMITGGIKVEVDEKEE